MHGASGLLNQSRREGLTREIRNGPRGHDGRGSSRQNFYPSLIEFVLGNFVVFQG